MSDDIKQKARKPTIYELEKILEEAPGTTTIAPDGSVHVGPSYEELEEALAQCLTQCKEREWISVEDELPEYTARAGSQGFVHVIGFHQLGVTEVMYCNGQWLYSHGIDINVTKWMPLPKPPQD